MVTSGNVSLRKQYHGSSTALRRTGVGVICDSEIHVLANVMMSIGMVDVNHEMKESDLVARILTKTNHRGMGDAMERAAVTEFETLRRPSHWKLFTDSSWVFNVCRCVAVCHVGCSRRRRCHSSDVALFLVN